MASAEYSVGSGSCQPLPASRVVILHGRVGPGPPGDHDVLGVHLGRRAGVACETSSRAFASHSCKGLVWWLARPPGDVRNGQPPRMLHSLRIQAGYADGELAASLSDSRRR